MRVGFRTPTIALENARHIVPSHQDTLFLDTCFSVGILNMSVRFSGESTIFRIWLNETRSVGNPCLTDDKCKRSSRIISIIVDPAMHAI